MTQFKIRFAKKSDRETILNICQNTWQDSEDYIPLVWDKWLEDSRGKIFVVTTAAEDIPIAIRRVVLMSENESWWEGFRVHPNYRKYFLSIISLVEKHINQYLLENNISRSRSCVLVNNKVMNLFTAKRKKREIIDKYVFCNIQPIDSPIEKAIKLNLDDLDSILSLIEKYNPKQTNPIYIDRGAKWQELTKAGIINLINDARIWGIKDKEQLLSIATKTKPESSRNSFWIGYLNGEPATLSTLLFEIRKIADNLKCSTVGGYLPDRENIINSLNNAGYKIISSQNVFVYQWENQL